MPLYEYECAKCKRRVEKIQKFSDPILKTCEHCGGKLERLLSSPAIRFKGSGWYVNDYAKKSTPAKDSSSDDSSKPASGKEGESTKTKEAESSKSKTSESAKSSEPAKTGAGKSKDK